MAPLFFPGTVDAATAAAGAKGAGASANATSQTQFWAIFSLTFIGRPFGGVLFAAIADLKGRKPALLLSVAFMGVASLLLGCLPTYQHIGVAAPVLLALLRFAQGLALGGEFAAALVAAFELAPAGGKNFGGTFAYIASAGGTMLGIVVPLIVVTALQDNTPALMLWGWRLPFLLSVVAALAALALRSTMVEPDAILEAIERDRRAAMALDAADEATAAAEARAKAAGEAEAGAGGLGVHHRRPALPEAAPENSMTPLAAAAGAASTAAAAVGRAPAPPAAESSVAARLRPPRPPRHHRAFPLVPVLRHHWKKVLLQCAYTAMGTCVSVSYTGWISLGLLGPPVFLPRAFSFGLGLVALAISSLVGLVFARLLLDSGRVRPLHLGLVGIVLSIATPPAVLIGIIPRLAPAAGGGSHAAKAALMLLISYCVSLAAFIFASLSASMSRLYPTNLRVSGFSLAHNVATSVFGGLTPIFLTQLQAMAPKVGPSAYLAAVSSLSAVACVLLMRFYPRTNMTPLEAVEADKREMALEAAGGGLDGDGDGVLDGLKEEAVAPPVAGAAAGAAAAAKD
jgi:MFS family permease